MTAATGGAYPASFSVDTPEELARWRPFVQWFLAIPHLLILEVLEILNGLATLVAWFAILFTGRDLDGLQGLRLMRMRYMMRTQAYTAFLVDGYPPFTFETTGAEPGDHPGVRVAVTPQVEGRNRLTAFFRPLLAIPHLLVMLVLVIAAFVSVVIAAFAVLLTGSWPDGLRDFVTRVMRRGVRVQAYVYLLTDEYPPFTLD